MLSPGECGHTAYVLLLAMARKVGIIKAENQKDLLEIVSKAVLHGQTGMDTIEID